MNLFSDRPSDVRPICEQPHGYMQYELRLTGLALPDPPLLVNRSISVDQQEPPICQKTKPPSAMNL